MGLICVIGEFSDVFFRLVEDFSVISGNAIGRVDCPDCVVVIGKGAVLADVHSVSGVIVSEDNSCKVPSGIQLITCGISHKNAVSVTSRTEERLILSLNRSVHTKSGIAEPLELPVAANADEYELMAAFAARLLLT